MEKAREVLKKVTIGITIVLVLVLIFQLVSLLTVSHQTINVSSQGTYYSGLNAIFEVHVNQENQQPLEANLKVKLLNSKQKAIAELYKGKTDINGRAVVSFETPKVPDGEYYLEITAKSKAGKDVIRQKVNIYSEQSSGHATITMDKALYKPGDTIQYRVLVTDLINDKPVENDVEVVILDGRENQVYKKTMKTSKFGIVSGSFTLADRVNSGMYMMKVQSGSKTYQREFEVKPYKLPKFEVTITTDKDEYRLGEELKGSIKAEYFFSQPVKNAAVEIQLGQNQPTGLTLNEQGECDFTYKITVEGQYEIVAEVTDSSNNRESGNTSVFFSDKNLKVTLKAEGNTALPGVPNEIFIFVSKLDGSPLKTYLKVFGDANLELATDENGMASFFAQPPMGDRLQLHVDALEFDEIFTFEIPVSENWADVIVRPDKPVFQENDTIPLTIIRHREAPVWVYAVKNGQIITALKTESEKTDLVLPSGTYGMIDLVYGFEEPARTSVLQTLSSSRSVFVRPGKGLNLKIKKEDKVYRPGEDISLSFQATDEKNNAVNSAILLTIADEALLSLADNDITLDNIKLALSQIEEERGVDADELYEAILNNSSDAVLTSLMLNESGFKPQLLERSYNNYARRSSITEALILWSIGGILVLVILLCVIFKKFRAGVLYFLGYIPIFLLSGYVASELTWRFGYYFETAVIIIIILLFLACYIGIILAMRKAFTADKNLRYVLIPVYFILIVVIFVLIIGCSAAPSVHYEQSTQSAPSANGLFGGDRLFDGMMKGENTTAGAIPPTAAAPSDSFKDSMAPAAEQAANEFAAVEKVRRRFMEVMLFHPQLEAKDGNATITVPLADNITNWSVQAVANSLEGHIGSGTGSISVFQEFFVDFDAPWNLAVGDEAGIPVTISNYLKQPQTVRLQVQKGDWFELTGGNYTMEMELGSEERRLVYIPIKVITAGTHKLRVDAAGQAMADAVEKEIRVYPAGLLRQEIAAAGLVEKESMNQVFFLTPDIEDARNIRVKLFPSSMSQVVEGLEGMLRFPDGCFEQISSSLYPNILVLKYLQDNKLSNPEIEQMAYDYIEKGFQKILTYEVRGMSGAFSLYGDPPAENILTAYGLMEFTDLSRVYDVDQGLLERMKEYLFTQQNNDGTFQFEEHHYGAADTSDRLALNAYIGWALSEACGDDPRLEKTISYLKGKMGDVQDGYTLSLIANILVNTKDKDAKGLLDRLAAMVISEQDKAYIRSTTIDYYGACGQIQDLQATALTSTAFTRAKAHQTVNNRMLSYIISQRDSYGTFGNTQATILSLKAMVAATEAATMKEGTITLKVNDREEKIEINSDSLSYYISDFKGAGKENTVRIQTTEGSFNYEIIKEYYVPYNSVQSGDSFEINMKMGKAFSVNDAVTQEIRITNRRDEMVENMMVLLQIPQGFTVNDTFLEDLKAEGIISEYSIGYDLIEIYIRRVQPQEYRTLKLGYWAGYPVKVLTGSVTVYDYYNPDFEAILSPVELTVTAP
ncbi:MAG: hypothetical protein KBA53_05940 [Thermoclostridium sp.]|nr:hypothetical protein [Thermoclostridium sp.]